MHISLLYPLTNHDFLQTWYKGGGASDIFALCFSFACLNSFVRFTSLTQIKIRKCLCYLAPTRLAPSIAKLCYMAQFVNESQPKLARFSTLVNRHVKSLLFPPCHHLDNNPLWRELYKRCTHQVIHKTSDVLLSEDLVYGVVSEWVHGFWSYVLWLVAYT
jgi:hypothetical protein